MRSASCGVVIEPSTSERSYGPSHDRARRLEEVGDLDRAGDREQLVLAVEQGELAAVAGGELPDGERGLAARGHGSDLPHRERGAARARRGRPARPCRRTSGPSWQWPQKPTRALHVALQRDEDALGADAAAAERVGREAHHDLRAAHERDRVARVEGGARRSARVTTPTSPGQPRVRAVDRDRDRRRRRALRQRSSSRAVEDVLRAARAVEEHDAAEVGRAAPRSRRAPAAAARARCPPATSTTSRPAARSSGQRACRTARARRASRRGADAASPASPCRPRGSCARATPARAGSPLIEIGTSPTPKT